MFIFLQQIATNFLHSAEKAFSASFLQSITPPHLSQKKIKNLILKDQFNLTESQLTQAHLAHQRENHYFSASYSEDRLFLAIDQQKIGVDIEVLKPRIPSLLQKRADEQLLLWGQSRENFYRLWTAKEAILKASDSQNLDLIEQISLLWVKKISEHIWDLAFDLELSFVFGAKNFLVKSFQKADLIWAITSLPRST